MVEARLRLQQRGTVRESLQALALELNLAHLRSVLVLLIIVGIVHLNVIARHVVDGLEVSAHFHYHLLFEVLGLVSAKNINVAIVKHAGGGVVAALIQLGVQLEPPIFVDVVALHVPLRLLKLFKLDERLVAAAPDRVDVPVTSLRVGEVRPARVHELALFECCPPRNVLVILI